MGEAGQRQFALQRSGGGGEGGHAGRDRVSHPSLAQAPQLLAHGAEDREIARMEPGDVLAPCGRLDAERNNRVEIERRGVDDPRPRRAMLEQRRRDERAGVEADRAAGDEIAPAHGDEIGAPGPAPMKCTVIVAPGKERRRRSRRRPQAAAKAAARQRPLRPAPRPRRYWARRTALAPPPKA